MLYIIYQVDKADVREAREIRERTRATHLAYLERHKDILVLGGALLADEGDGRLGSVLIINVPSRAAADAFSADEPFRKAGLFQSVSITRMRRGQWNPAAAPTTAEGN
ncbi:MAG TPA: YciI family protein [Alphaproteobacteria bacterium]|nr:YciI family protein [Alphaproteobacteria bacterium]